MKNFLRSCATLGPLGYMPASGTLGSIVALIMIWQLWYLHCSVMTIFMICAGMCCIVYWLLNQVLSSFIGHDPACVIIDEVVGMFVATVGIEHSGAHLITAFLLFRAFDIIKPFGIHYIEQLPGAAGVLGDDIAAAVAANITIQVLSRWFGIL